MTPNGIGLIEWVALGGEVKRGWGHDGWRAPSGYLPGNPGDVFANTYAAGDLAQLWLDYGYSSLNRKRDIDRSRSISKSKIVQTRHYPTAALYDFILSHVTDLRGAGLASDFSAFEAFFDTAIEGVEFLWFPDYENSPTEYFTCILEKPIDPKRIGTQAIFDFSFNLRVATQFTSTVLAFT